MVFAVCIYLVTGIVEPVWPDYSGFNRSMVTVTGSVYRKEYSNKQDKSTLVLYLRPNGDINAPSPMPDKNIICYTAENQKEPEIGSTVKVRGILSSFEASSNPGQFDALFYYRILQISFRLNQAEIQAKSIEYSKAGELLYRIRRYFSSVFDRYLSKETASVMKTMLLGEKGELDQDIKTLYQQNGIAHVLAISGIHVSILGMGIFKLLKKISLPIKAAVVVSAAFMLMYVCMTGFGVSSVRAVIMFLVNMGAYLVGRTYDMLTAAALSAALILCRQPYYLYNSSFLFTFGCVVVIAILVPALGEATSNNDNGKSKKAVLSGMAVFMGTLPLNLWFFYQFPPYAVFLNLLVIPCMSIIMAAGILLMLTGSISIALGAVPAAVITLLLKVYEICCRLCEKLPFHLVTSGRPDLIKVLLYCAVLILVSTAFKKLKLGIKWGIVLAAACLLLVSDKGKLSVTFLDVGQGDSIHIESPSGRHYLIDGGSSSVKGVGNYRLMPYLKFKGAAQVEAVFITHPDEDHCNGIIELLEAGAQQGIKVKTVFLPDVSESVRTEAYIKLEDAARNAEAELIYISKGQWIQDEEMTLQCLHPGKGESIKEANAYSTVISLTYGKFKAFFTGDIEGEGEDILVSFLNEQAKETEGYTVLKVAHHGSSGSTDTDMLSRLQPEFAVISCGRNNSYGHPHKELLERLKEANARIFITYETGAVTFLTDGKKLQINKFLKKSTEGIFQP